MSDPTEAREYLLSALYADLIGPAAGWDHRSDAVELLDQRPSRRYLAGFLVPKEDRDSEAEEEPIEVVDARQSQQEADEDKGPPQSRQFPASFGLSAYVPPAATSVSVSVQFARYQKAKDPEGSRRAFWQRVPRAVERLQIPLDEKTIQEGVALADLPSVKLKGKLEVIPSAHRFDLAPGTKALSLFLVNEHPVSESASKSVMAHDREEKTLFQCEMSISCDHGFAPRPNLAGLVTAQNDPDALQNDLHYREKQEYVVGHNVSGVAGVPDEAGRVTSIRTEWVPSSEVPVVDALRIKGVNLEMLSLSQVESGAALSENLMPIVSKYRSWIDEQKSRVGAHGFNAQRREVAEELLQRASKAAERIEDGIRVLASNDEALKVFRWANKAMNDAAMKRNEASGKKDTKPAWRLFQLAFLLLNVPSLVDPQHVDRKRVELLFFPTGGGKTEAYLGVIAFTLLLRRLRGQSEEHKGAGVAVLLRYTLRLLTLDQLGRATTLMCALELIRRANPDELGKARLAMGLYVGQTAAPNFVGDLKKIHSQDQSWSRRESLPLDQCPWCSTKLSLDSVDFAPQKKPSAAYLVCMNHGQCEFANNGDEALARIPLVWVDEHVYHELPAFIIGTVDKFAMIPLRAEAGKLFGRVRALDGDRYIGYGEKKQSKSAQSIKGLLPPDLIVQDELHLIAGPLGTMVGLYETAISGLSDETPDGTPHLPKIIASTATANRADKQVHALYGRHRHAIFPPPGIDAMQTFFSYVNEGGGTEPKPPGRLYVGVAAPGHPMKRIMLRTYTALMSAARKRYDDSNGGDLADAYMTLVGYFNSLRELGGMRRIAEDDLHRYLAERSEYRPVDSSPPAVRFSDRKINQYPFELTSRKQTHEIKADTDRLRDFYKNTGDTDVLLASNMISVGVDIDRLGLMVVAGQPKTTSEYIQATSRVGRDRNRPGLVVTCYNMAKPRDRSHYEHFATYHESFYRFVEAQSVTPFSDKALERGLTGAMLALIRHHMTDLTPPEGPSAVKDRLDEVERLAEKVFLKRYLAGPEKRQDEDEVTFMAYVKPRLNKWRERAHDSDNLAWSQFDEGTKKKFDHLLTPRDEKTASSEHLFAVPTSLRDVEGSVDLWLPKGEDQ